jgi:hypothetical protein
MTDNLKATLDERGGRYGPFDRQARIAQDLKAIVRNALSYNQHHETMVDDRRKIVDEGLDMILHKIARLANGLSDDMDSWFDIAGYATIVHRDLHVPLDAYNYTLKSKGKNK